MENKNHIKIFLAPMEGVVDAVTRELLSKTGAIDFCTTEFLRINSQLYPKKVYYKNNPELLTGAKTKSGTQVIFQILGSDLSAMAENAAHIVEAGATAIDINFGCPAKTVNKHDGGATLLKNPERLFQVTRSVKNSLPSHIPLSTKVRLGYDHKDYVTEIALACEAGGSNRLTVHARTKIEGYLPPAHWEHIATMKDAIKIPVVANGEIWNVDDFIKCREITGCNEFMLGRGLIANPFLAREIKHFVATSEKVKTRWEDLTEYISEFTTKTLKYRGERYAITRLKQMTKQMTKTFPEAITYFEKIRTCQKVPSYFG